MRGGVCCVVFAIVGCFHPAFSHHPACGPGGACPVGTQCLREVCVASECGEAPDGEPCANPATEDGVCRAGACIARGCGDGIVGLDAAGRPEVCDDGNQVGGDGCSADCMSDESCGNGVVDSVAGEACDDGVTGKSGDGCSSRCTTEVLDWRRVPTSLLLPRFGSAMAFDARRGRMVMFGGTERIEFFEHQVAETWEYDGASWSQPALPVSPPPEAVSAMAFDPARGTIVMGGDSPWEYTGATWRRPAPSPPPAASTPRDEPGVVFDAGRGRYERLEGAELGEFDGQNWQPRQTSGLPALAAPVLMYDAARGRLAVVALDAGTVATYVLDGASWNLVAPALAPPPRSEAAIAYDSIRHLTVLFGGLDPAPRTALVDTWEFDGATWTSSARASKPAPEDTGSAVFDPRRGSVVWSDGSDTWELDASGWHLRPAAGAPGALCQGDSMAFDSLRHRAIAIGGCGPGTLGQTWAFDGQWRAIPTAHAPAPTRPDTIAMAYDAARDRVVLYDIAAGATWLFDGSDWNQLLPGLGAAGARPRAPDTRFGTVMEFDAARGVIVRFGVSQTTEDGVVSDSQTSEFDGAQWIDRAPATRPRPRAQPALAYDPVRRRIVVFGGGPTNPDDGRTAINDVWEYDGNDWTERTTVVRPPAVVHPALAFDALRGRIVLAGEDSWALGFVSDVPAELCIAGVDTDGDGLAGCDDPDCAALCAGCGDGVCNAAVEGAVCPADCGP